MKKPSPESGVRSSSKSKSNENSAQVARSGSDRAIGSIPNSDSDLGLLSSATVIRCGATTPLAGTPAACLPRPRRPGRRGYHLPSTYPGTCRTTQPMPPRRVYRRRRRRASRVKSIAAPSARKLRHVLSIYPHLHALRASRQRQTVVRSPPASDHHHRHRPVF